MTTKRDSIVDRSLIQAMGRARLPSMVGTFAAVVLIGLINGWPLGVLPVIISGISATHALYERFTADADRALGLSFDVIVILYLIRHVSGAEVIVAYGMMFVVFASYFTDGWKRVALFSEISAVVAAAMTIEVPQPPLSPGIQQLLGVVLPIHAVLVVIFALSLGTRELRRSEVQRGYVLGTVAHELRNDLTPVVGLSGVLLDELREMGRPELAEMAGIITAQAMQASDTIDDLLTMARIDREALGLNLRPIDLTDAVSEVIVRYGLQSFVSQPKEHGVQATADPIRVRQIVRNLCSNAHRYGGEAVEVVVEVDDKGACHVLVRDNGAGIAPDEVMAVFEPFGRGSAGRLNEASVGLGLWLSRELARAMDGDLSYRREDGWSVFDLSLPARNVELVRMATV